MLFRCDWCGEIFDEPDTRRVTENLDGENGWWTHTEEYCPRCGFYTISWKSQQRSTFQPKAFAQAYPNIDLTPFYKTSSTRPFKVMEKKNDD